MMNARQPGAMRNAGAVRLLSLLGGAMWLSACPMAGAQDITDPTRPPQYVDTASEPGTASGLQSVFISDTRKAALIGGQLVELGHKYGDATLVRVSENEVTLARGREKEVLHLFPGIEKKMVVARPDPAAPAPVRKKAKSRGNK
jgi:MSHA biogenesis protein MshK